MKMQQSGVAIITALLVVALVTSIAGFLAWRQQLWLRTVENQTHLAQAKGIARAALNLIRNELNNDAKRGQVPYDHPGEAWAVPIQSIPVEQGAAGGVVRDLQGRFNLNNLIDSAGQSSPSGVAAFRRLLVQLQLPPELADYLLDWLDSNSEVSFGAGAEDSFYLALASPYRLANQRLVELKNLYRVRGFSPGIVEQLAPFVCILPKPTAVNINFTTPQVLRAVLPGLSPEMAAELVRRSQSQPYETVDRFRQDLPDDLKAQLAEGTIDVSTRYFEAATHAQFGSVTVALTALLHRPEQGFPQIEWLRRSDWSERLPQS